LDEPAVLLRPDGHGADPYHVLRRHLDELASAQPPEGGHRAQRPARHHDRYPRAERGRRHDVQMVGVQVGDQDEVCSASVVTPGVRPATTSSRC
jgi:hypothetical protein